MVPETLYLTVNLIDRYLEKKQVRRSKLQLVGVAALLVSLCHMLSLYCRIKLCGHIMISDKVRSLCLLWKLMRMETSRLTHPFPVIYIRA
jgi:Cyclin, N-terminal domain